jgi:cytidylate kinase
MNHTSPTRPYVVAVDGPAGSGKSSICGLAAARLGWSYLSTGVLYRAVGVIAHQRMIASEDTDSIALLIDELCQHMTWRASESRVMFRGEDISPLLGTNEAGNLASRFAKLSVVRQKLLPLQRKMILSAPVGVIADGRDIGTVVFPDADLKIFMTASIEERAKRRVRQLKSNESLDATEIERIRADIIRRDHQDEQRGEAPLRKADDAIEFDNSNATIDGSVLSLVELIRSHLRLP